VLQILNLISRNILGGKIMSKKSNKKIYRGLAAFLTVAAIFLTGAGLYHGASVGVLVFDGGVIHNIFTDAANVEELLDEMGVELYRFDNVNVPLSTKIAPGLVVEIERARPVFISIDGNEPFRFFSRPNSALSTILADFSQPLEESFLLNESNARHRPQANEVVNISTVNWTTRQVYVEVAYGREYVNNYRMEVGTYAFYRAGEFGVGVAHYNVEWVSGTENSANRTHTTIVQAPVAEIIHIGADLPPNHHISACGEVFSYSRLVLMESTAYTLSESCTGRTPDSPWWGITASGMHVGVGIVAVDTNVFPFHTRMYIEGYGFAVAGDRGGAIRGYKVDVFLETMAEVRAWGRRHNVRVWILE